MVFSSVIFLFVFLPIFLLVYFLVPNKVQLKNLVLLLFSLLFYAWGEQEIVLIMLASCVVDYWSARAIEKGYRKWGLVCSLLFNLGFLLIFKYLDFTFEVYNDLISSLFPEKSLPYLASLPHIALPIGISFYTFQTMSYTIDVYYGKVKANKSFIEFSTYVTMFPQLVAGPIVRYADIQKSLSERTTTVHDFAIGAERFIIGLAKKVLIANYFAYWADYVFGLPDYSLGTAVAWVGIICYSFQIYFDFSGYSDMAIGLGRMLGFRILENFNYPYISKSIKEFWRRWHISLSSWFRDYLYIPLGGNRKGRGRTYLNLFIVFFITGLWHGSSWNFIVWGLFHGLFLVFERLGLDKVLDKLWKPIQHIYTLLIALVGWVFFRADDLPTALDYLGTMFIFNVDTTVNFGTFVNFEFVFYFIVACLLSTPFYLNLTNKYITAERTNYTLALNVHRVMLVGLLIITIIFVSSSSYNPFIYFRF